MAQEKDPVTRDTLTMMLEGIKNDVGPERYDRLIRALNALRFSSLNMADEASQKPEEFDRFVEGLENLARGMNTLPTRFEGQIDWMTTIFRRVVKEITPKGLLNNEGNIVEP